MQQLNTARSGESIPNSSFGGSVGGRGKGTANIDSNGLLSPPSVSAGVAGSVSGSSSSTGGSTTRRTAKSSKSSPPSTLSPLSSRRDGSGSESNENGEGMVRVINTTAIPSGFPSFSDPEEAARIEQMRMDKIIRRQNRELQAMLTFELKQSTLASKEIDRKLRRQQIENAEKEMKKAHQLSLYGARAPHASHASANIIALHFCALQL